MTQNKNSQTEVKNQKERPLEKWAKKIDWQRRIKAVCKPCWEIKYCPYGVLIEDFPLHTDTSKSCRIYGHDCPVFYVAEPFTETKSLRNISRKIPMVTRFRVLKRENQICSACGQSIRDGEYEFDHIIPWSKGGSSDEHNVTLLCEECNRKKGKQFEDRHLVTSISEHQASPIKVSMISFLLDYVSFAHRIFNEKGRVLEAADVCKQRGGTEIDEFDQGVTDVIADINRLFRANDSGPIKQKTFHAIQYRWGFSDSKIHKILETANKYAVSTDELLFAEQWLINLLGWRLELTETNKKKWLSL